MPERSFDLAVLGAGPAGLVAALAAAQRADVALVAARLPREDDPVRVDAVPARLLALLMDLGLSPKALGVERLHARAAIGWSQPVPHVRQHAPMAHVERPLLDGALLARVLGQPRIVPFISTVWSGAEGAFHGDGWRARRLVDATGRAAVSAAAVVRPQHPWASRTLWHAAQAGGSGPPFALAALPDGYVYRIAGQQRIAVGFVGRGPALHGAPEDLAACVLEADAGWILDGLPRLETLREGRAAPASVQWSLPPDAAGDAQPTRIGDAALARDPLSSQGIAGACSEALYVATLETPGAADAFRLRQGEQRRGHLKQMQRLIQDCRYAHRPPWREYAAFVARHVGADGAQATAALREGAIVRLERAGVDG